jgi:hypothetical protein
MGFARGRHELAAQGAGGRNEQVVRAQWIGVGFQFVKQGFGHESTAADERFGKLNRQGLFGDSLRRQINAQDCAGISV